MPAIIGAYATARRMMRLVILENRIADLNFSSRASGVRTRYTPVVLAPAMKIRVHASAKPRFAPMYAVANRNDMRTVKINVCPRTPGERSSLIELGR